MRIYTKTGDLGETGLLAGPRLGKDHVRIEAYGAVDELSAALGVALTHDLPESVRECLLQTQRELFRVGAELATPRPLSPDAEAVTPDHVARLEARIDDWEAGLPPLKNFILPGGTPAAAAFHVARTVCRRAERRVVALMRQPSESVPPSVLVYLNRLSDLLFVAARFANAERGVSEEPWRKTAGAAEPEA